MTGNVINIKSPTVVVDPNSFARRNSAWAVATFDDVDYFDPMPRVGDLVIASQPSDTLDEPDFVGTARVAEIDEAHRLIYLDVDWGSFRDDPRWTDPRPRIASDPTNGVATQIPRSSGTRMRLTSAFLADHVTVADNILNVLGGGISVLYRSEYPAVVDAFLVLIAEVDEADADHEIPVAMIIESSDTDDVIARMEGVFAATLRPSSASWGAISPIVVDLHGVSVPRAGRYRITGSVGSDSGVDVKFVAVTR